MKRTLVVSCAFLLASACAQDPNGILLELAPEVVSSIDGTLQVRAIVVANRTPLSGESVNFSVIYVDRNGVDHAIASQTADTGSSGSAEIAFSGLRWEGTGTVTATLVDGAGAPVLSGGVAIADTATFAVLDRTPPTATILPPTVDLRIGPGLPFDVTVEVTDEIGVSEVFVEAAGEVQGQRSTVIASGATSKQVTFQFDVPLDARPGPNVTLYALVSDLSGNQTAADPVVLTVDPAIAIATPIGLAGSLLSEGDGNFLDWPTALTVSPHDGMIYVTDNSGGATCQGRCIRKVDPSTGLVVGGAVVVGVGTLEGIALDASGDNLYYSDRPNILSRLTWDAGTTSYRNPAGCNNLGGNVPQDPRHLVFDETDGILVTDINASRVMQQATCNINASIANYGSSTLMDRPWGIALGEPNDLYVSDDGTDEILHMDMTTGTVSLFEWRRLDQPRGLVWLSGGSSAFADSLLIANRNARTVSSTQGLGQTRSAVYLRNDPVDVHLVGDTLYILTEPSQGSPGRIFVVTGF